MDERRLAGSRLAFEGVIAKPAPVGAGFADMSAVTMPYGLPGWEFPPAVDIGCGVAATIA